MAKKTQKPKIDPKAKQSHIGDSKKSHDNLRKGMEIPPKKKDE